MASGTDADFLEFAAACSGRLFRSACLLSGDWHAAEDLLQETLGKLYPRWRRIGRLQWPIAYAHTTLVRTYLAQQRRRSSGERPTETLPETLTSDGDAALRLTLLDGLARLSARDRAVLVLRYWEDRSVQETADMLDLSTSAVRVSALRALERLRVLLGDQLLELALDRP